jgi:coenzyme F420-reducing hydrogenase beta subunit
MKLVTDQNRCSGCMACLNVCPISAISVMRDEKGFYHPYIENDKCTNCNTCNKACPIQNEIKETKIFESFLCACWTKDDVVRKESTSGGLFSVIAEDILNNGGVVIGAVFDGDFNVTHTVVEDIEDLNLLRGSKYVQSNIGSIYKIVKIYLEKGRLVLFTGTPCQVDGLLHTIKLPFENLITLDIICHGAPSPKVFKSYMQYIDENVSFGEKIIGIKFRYKNPSWTVFSMRIEFDSGRVYMNDMYNDPYLQCFLGDYITRASCHKCIYTNTKRISDITLGDFWGYMSSNKELKNDEKGISLMMVNSDKGINILNRIKDKIIHTEKSIDEAIRGNQCLKMPFLENPKTPEFWSVFLNYGFKSTVEKFFIKKRKMSRKFYFNQMYRNHAYLIPRPIQFVMNNLIIILKNFLRRGKQFY